MSTAGVPTEVAWLFVRADESVRLELSQNAAAVRLDVWGPGRARSVHEFDDTAAAVSAADNYQATLISEGFVLQARAERRQGADGGGEPGRDSTDRRRRGR